MLSEFGFLALGAVFLVGGLLLLWYGLLKRGMNNEEPQWHWPVIPFLISAVFDPGHALLYGSIGVALGSIAVVVWILERMNVL